MPAPKFRGRLSPYQRDALAWMLRREESTRAPGGLVSLEMGLGKTVLTIALMVARPLAHTLVVVPKSIVGQWRDEIRRFSTLEPVVLSARDVKAFDPERFSGAADNPAARATNVTITSYSCLSSAAGTAAACAGTPNAFRAFPFDRLVLDEAHCVKNRASKTHRFVRAMAAGMARGGAVWCLTGTPITRDERDVRAVLDVMGVLDPNVHRAMQMFAYRRTREDVGLPLPALTIETVASPFLTREELDAYADLAEQGRDLYRRRGGVSSASVLAHLIRMRQCVAGPTKLRMLTEDFVATVGGAAAAGAHGSGIREPTVVFCSFHAEMDGVERALADLGVRTARIDGGKSSEQREAAIRAFEDGHVTCLVIQIDAGGLGLNLTEATRVYITSLHWNATSELQAIARAHRLGQTRPVTVKRLAISGTIDEHILAVQQRKLDCAARVLADDRVKTMLHRGTRTGTRTGTGTLNVLLRRMFAG